VLVQKIEGNHNSWDYRDTTYRIRFLILRICSSLFAHTPGAIRHYVNCQPQ